MTRVADCSIRESQSLLCLVNMSSTAHYHYLWQDHLLLRNVYEVPMHSMIGSGKTGLVTNDSKFLTQTQGFMNVLYLINVHSQRAISGWPV